MSWVDYVIRTEGIRAIYGDHLPGLDGITLREVTLDYEYLSVMLGFDLPELPVVMPKKWERKGADSVRLKLDFLDPSELAIQGWTAPLKVDLRMKKTDNGEVSAVIDSGEVYFSATARFASIREISAHKSPGR
ncbi:Immunity protein 50 [Actinopolyspora xinjiangensis]|uniref:Immunity protein 50 n=1 Tax=Actinopolyspora xinjiangensis TaxID=405564 RepID=A0A1H0W0Y6_9ACTN|nr:Imm50 family immunity protein [Actinopolyspora xinjiangensis]SDP84369.1 Immunity protein 50 [Actinopolyspora xinjiangensis]